MSSSPSSPELDKVQAMDTPSSSRNAEKLNNIDIVKRSDSEHDIKEKLEAAKLLAERYDRQLQEERSYRQELEKVFEKRSKELEEAVLKHEQNKTELSERITKMEEDFKKELKATQDAFDKLDVINNQQRDAFNLLSDRYQRLSGHYEKTANQMRDEQITLPETTAELQFECLRLRESLIESTALKEHLEEEHASEIEVLHTELYQARDLYRSRVPRHSQSERQSPDNNEIRQTIGDLEKRLVESQAEYNALSKSLEEYRQRCSQLQTELNNSEVVQRDFVKLSQRLQIQIETIRQGDNEVRFQFPEDVKNCNDCGSEMKTKINCKHCGKIFCPSCVQKILAGPNNKEASVCRICFTLLSKNSAPFYSN